MDFDKLVLVLIYQIYYFLMGELLFELLDFEYFYFDFD